MHVRLLPLSAFLLVLSPFAWADGPFRLTMLDVGQGDGLIIQAPAGCVALIDGGPPGGGQVVKDYLGALGVSQVDFAISSHYHADHITGMVDAERGAGAVYISTVYDRAQSYNSAIYRTYEAQFAGRRVMLSQWDSFSLCGQVDFVVLAIRANGIATSDENAQSILVKVTFNHVHVLLGGDLTGAATYGNVESAVIPFIGDDVDVYKVHHHGSNTSSNTPFLNAMLPTVSFIPVGWNNTYGHPGVFTVQRLLDVGTVIWQTEDPQARTALGNIELTSDDGIWYTVQQGDRVETYASKDQPLARLRQRFEPRRSTPPVQFTWNAPFSKSEAPSPAFSSW